MREILFRGECTETGDWVKGHYVRLFDDKGNRHHRIYTGCAELDCGDLYPDWYDVDPETVGQYTGLTDKNGVKIFEGDILKSANIFVVGFEDGSIVLRFKKNGLEYAHEHYLDEMLVIGNIYDNPELLEE